MKIAEKASIQFRPIWGLLTFVASLVFLVGLARSAEVASKTAAGRTDTAKVTNAVVIPKSIFSSNDPGAKDPFFPGRVRGVVTTPGPTAPKPIDYSELQLRGITGVGDKRIALINNQTFAKGDEGEVRMGSLRVKITVVDIREKSVLITVAGQDQPRELVLQDRVLPLE